MKSNKNQFEEHLMCVLVLLAFFNKMCENLQEIVTIVFYSHSVGQLDS